MARAPSPGSDSVAVIGLGRFGGAVAESLVRLGPDVLGLDDDAELVQSWADRLTHVVQADTTNGDTLRRLGVHEFDELAVMVDTFRPLELGEGGRACDDGVYAQSWTSGE